MSEKTPTTHVAIVPKNKREEIRCSLYVYNGMQLADLRVFADCGDDGDRRPTKKGVSVRVEKIRALIDALLATEAEAKRLGLLPGGAS
jgi:hypothetical protein